MNDGQIRKINDDFYVVVDRNTKYKLDRFPNLNNDNIGDFADFTLININDRDYVNTLKIGDVEYEKVNPPRNNANKKFTDRTNYNNKNNNQNNNQNRKQQNNRQANNNNNTAPATAPYNFITLNNKVVPSEFTAKKEGNNIVGLNEVSFDKWYNKIGEKNILNGFIDYEITNITDLFIGNEPGKIKTNDKGKIIEEERNFYTIGKHGEKAISGASFRGLIKNMMAICSYSKLSQIDNKDKFLFYRRVAQKNEDLDFKYNSTIGSFGKNVKAGYLYYDMNSHEYKIFQSDKKFIKIKTSVYEDNSNLEIINYSANNFTYKIIYTNTDCDNYSINKSSEFHKEVTLVFSGYINGKKNQWIIYNDFNKQPINLNKSIVEKYKNDSYRNINIDILDEAEKGKKVPVFFIVNNNDVLAFGHTPFFRLPYEKSIADHLPNNHQDFNQLDITEALFGMTGKTGNQIFASRLHFMDAIRIKESEKEEYIDSQQPKILASPKPTAYKMYVMNGADWNSSDNIRGNKLYHHKNADWIFKPTENEKVTDSHPPKIKPLKDGNVFKGRIYFDNLSEIELGALLFVLKLKEDLCLKIGMGKPYGMGSIKIDKLHLTIINRKARYTSLFTNDNTAFNLGIDDKKETDSKINTYIEAFEKHILTSIGSQNTSLWNEDRMKELALMLNIKNKDIPKWDEKTRYLTLGDKEPYKADKQRWKTVLPFIKDIVKP